MRMDEAQRIINNEPPKGYMVNFERVMGPMTVGDYFPDKHAGEELIETEEEAWDLAQQFAKATFGKCINIYMTDSNFNPVPGYEKKKIKNR